MTITYTDIRVQLVDHTVSERGGLLAGYLARDMASRKELGYVWRAGKQWRFRAPDGSSGERSSQHGAAATLRTLVMGCTATEEDDRRRAATARPIARPQAAPARPPAAPAPAPAPAPRPVQRIDWDAIPQVGDLTAAIAARLGKKS